MDLSILTTLVNADKVGGWVRAWTGSAIAVEIATHPAIAVYLPQEAQIALGVVAGAVAAGVWSTIAKIARSRSQASAAAVDIAKGNVG